MKTTFQKRVIAVLFMAFFFSNWHSLKGETNAADLFISTSDTILPRVIPGMKLVWNDEFNASGKPDPKNWGFEYGFVRNQELQWYQPQNAYCKDGLLIIEGRKEHVINPNYNPQSGDWRSSSKNSQYSSSSLLTRERQEWSSFGYYEIRARIDTSQGSWPAIWLLGTENEWPDCGEIDIMEFYRVDKKPNILANVAWGSKERYQAKWSSQKVLLSEFLQSDPDWIKKFHIWSMKWNEDCICLYIDDQLVNKTMLNKTLNQDGTNPFSAGKTHYLLLNLALGSNGGNPAQSQFPIKFEVDYVRLYKFAK